MINSIPFSSARKDLKHHLKSIKTKKIKLQKKAVVGVYLVQVLLMVVVVITMAVAIIGHLLAIYMIKCVLIVNPVGSVLVVANLIN